jgi:ParB-like chromosome segregation protein Spo0J
MRVPITLIRENPSNPRKLDRAKFEKLVQSIRDFPEMLDKRPIIVADGIILGGNMRHKAAIQAGMNEIPIIDASDWTEEQRQQFIIKDNVSFGEWDWDILANEWDPVDLELWGLDVWQPKEQEESVKEVCNCCGK